MTVVLPSHPPIAPHWIAADWGTSRLRLWAMTDDGTPLALIRSPLGMNHLQPHEFEPALLRIIEPWLTIQDTPDPITIVACGMVGAQQGWSEAPYVTTPCAPPVFGAMHHVKPADPRLALYIVPGVQQESPADVMRGEETQIAGWLHAEGLDAQGTLCLPGTHSKWVQIHNGHITALRTCLTGEMLQWLRERSVLRHSLPPESDIIDVDSHRANRDAFAEGLDIATHDSGSLLSNLFTIRARSLIQSRDPGLNLATLAGLIIGSEFTSVWDFWRGSRHVTLIAPGSVIPTYETALSHLGIRSSVMDPDKLVLDGLTQARRTIQDRR